MNLKEKCQMKVERTKAIAIISITFLLCTISVSMVVVSMLKKESYASTIPEEAQFTSNLQSNIDIMKILQENTSKQYREEFTVEERDLEYITNY